MGRRTILLIAAVVVAGLGTALVVGYVNNVRSAVASDLEDVLVLVAAQPIAAGTPVADAEAAGAFEQTVMTRESVAPGALSEPQAIRDLVALAPIYPGEQILSQKFGESGSVSRLALPKDKLAVSVQLSDPARVAGFVNPGSDVAVLLTTEPTNGSDAAAAADGAPAGSPSGTQPAGTRVLLARAPVIAVGESSLVSQRTTTSQDGSQTTEEIPRAILTLALDQKQAERIVFGQSQGELYLALLGEDATVRPGPGTSSDTLFAS
jgi:pilus assembly protein CpaB